jgi:hypothetical protein
MSFVNPTATILPFGCTTTSFAPVALDPTASVVTPPLPNDESSIAPLGALRSTSSFDVEMPAAMIFPSGWRAPARARSPKLPGTEKEAAPKVPKPTSGAPDAVKRTMSTWANEPLLPCPTTRIFPSGCTSTAAPLSLPAGLAWVAMPSPSNVGSRSPAAAWTTRAATRVASRLRRTIALPSRPMVTPRGKAVQHARARRQGKTGRFGVTVD